MRDSPVSDSYLLNRGEERVKRRKGRKKTASSTKFSFILLFEASFFLTSSLGDEERIKSSRRNQWVTYKFLIALAAATTL